MVMMAESTCSVDGESHRHLLFLEGEEDYEEIGLDDENENFIDDVLETTQWYTILNILHLTSTLLTVTDTVSQRDDPAKTLFDFTVKKLKGVTSSVVDSHFERYAHGNLKQRVL